MPYWRRWNQSHISPDGTSSRLTRLAQRCLRGAAFPGVAVHGWGIPAGSKNKDAAWEFLSWLQSTDGGEKLYTEAGEIFPALQSVAKTTFLTQTAPPANKQAFLTEGEASKVGGFGYFPDWDELSGTIIEPGMEKIWAGEQQPEEALPQICQQVDQFLKDKGYPTQKTSFQPPIVLSAVLPTK